MTYEEFIAEVRDDGWYPIFSRERYLYGIFRLVAEEGIDKHKDELIINTIERPTKIENAMLKYPLKGVYTACEDGQYKIHINPVKFMRNLSIFYMLNPETVEAKAIAREARYRKRLTTAEKTARKLGLQINPYRVYFSTGKMPTFGDGGYENNTSPIT